METPKVEWLYNGHCEHIGCCIINEDFEQIAHVLFADIDSVVDQLLHLKWVAENGGKTPFGRTVTL